VPGRLPWPGGGGKTADTQSTLDRFVEIERRFPSFAQANLQLDVRSAFKTLCSQGSRRRRSSGSRRWPGSSRRGEKIGAAAAERARPRRPRPSASPATRAGWWRSPATASRRATRRKRIAGDEGPGDPARQRGRAGAARARAVARAEYADASKTCPFRRRSARAGPSSTPTTSCASSRSGTSTPPRKCCAHSGKRRPAARTFVRAKAKLTPSSSSGRASRGGRAAANPAPKSRRSPRPCPPRPRQRFRPRRRGEADRRLRRTSRRRAGSASRKAAAWSQPEIRRRRAGPECGAQGGPRQPRPAARAARAACLNRSYQNAVPRSGWSSRSRTPSRPRSSTPPSRSTRRQDGRGAGTCQGRCEGFGALVG